MMWSHADIFLFLSMGNLLLSSLLITQTFQVSFIKKTGITQSLACASDSSSFEAFNSFFLTRADQNRAAFSFHESTHMSHDSSVPGKEPLTHSFIRTLRLTSATSCLTPAVREQYCSVSGVDWHWLQSKPHGSANHHFCQRAIWLLWSSWFQCKPFNITKFTSELQTLGAETLFSLHQNCHMTHWTSVAFVLLFYSLYFYSFAWWHMRQV